MAQTMNYEEINYEEMEKSVIADINKFINEKIDLDHRDEVKSLIQNALLYLLIEYVDFLHIYEEVFELEIREIIRYPFPEKVKKDVNDLLNRFRKIIGLSNRDNFKPESYA
jgi:hypothetical protein